jgi:hypothetical protein
MDSQTQAMAAVIICNECWSPAAVRRSADGALNLRCSNSTCPGARRWVTERVWGLMNCQGHCARIEVGVLAAAKQEQEP